MKTIRFWKERIPPGVYGGPLVCPVDMSGDRFVRLLQKPYFDGRGYQQAKRINGLVRCDVCRVWLPLVDEIEEWQRKERPEIGPPDLRWFGVGWGCGFAFCDCGRAFFESFDGVVVVGPEPDSQQATK